MRRGRGLLAHASKWNRFFFSFIFFILVQQKTRDLAMPNDSDDNDNNEQTNSNRNDNKTNHVLLYFTLHQACSPPLHSAPANYPPEAPRT